LKFLCNLKTVIGLDCFLETCGKYVMEAVMEECFS
jgi:hypothetical protein